MASTRLLAIHGDGATWQIRPKLQREVATRHICRVKNAGRGDHGLSERSPLRVDQENLRGGRARRLDLEHYRLGAIDGLRLRAASGRRGERRRGGNGRRRRRRLGPGGRRGGATAKAYDDESKQNERVLHPGKIRHTGAWRPLYLPREVSASSGGPSA